MAQSQHVYDLNIAKDKSQRKPAVPYSFFPDYVRTSAFLVPNMMRLGHGFVWAAATASRGTIAPMSTRRLNRYCTSAR